MEGIYRALLASVLLAAAVPAAADAQGGAVVLSECRLESAQVPGSVAARCGTLRVPENRAEPHGRQIALHVAVVPSLRLRARSDPLVLLAGGPGQAASDLYLTLHPAFARVRRDRDILLVDQRGTGRSMRLDCTYPQDLEIAAYDATALRRETRRCLETLPGDPRYYTTSVAVQDLDAVRAALGYERLNLYAVSYGTRVAQHYMRRYPQRVRTAILDGAVPPDLALGPDIPREAQRALDTLFERCAQSAECSARFPSLAQDFASLYARLQAAPAMVRLADPLTGAGTRVQFGVAHLASAVRMLSYSDETAALLPLLIHEAQVGGRLEALAAQYLMIQRSMERQMAYGMHFAVVCSEDAPRWAEGQAPDFAGSTYLGAEFMDGLRAVCDEWPRGPVDEDFGTTLNSDIPTLLLSGGNDPVTPAAYAERVLQGLSNARHLVLEGQGHGQIAVGCVPRLAAQFIAAASPADLDTQCTTHVTPAPFMLSLTAPAP